MKKFIVGAVVVIVVAVGAYLALTKVKAPTKGIQTAEILPQDVAFYYSLQNLESVWNNVKSSNFWKEFSELKLWQDTQVTSGIDDIKKQIKDNIGLELNEANFIKLAGLELAVAIIPDADQNKPPQVLIVFQGKTKQDITDVLTPVTEKIKKDDPTKFEQLQHKGETISHIKAASAEQPDIYLMQVKNILVVGVGNVLTHLQKTADLASGNAKDSLFSSANFKKACSFETTGKKIIGLFYMDFSKMKSYFQQLSALGGQNAAAPAAGTESINYIGGITELKDGLTTELFIYPNMSALSPEMKKMWETAPKTPETLKLTPEKALLYLGSTSIDLSALWNLWKENINKQPAEQAKPIMDTLNNFEKEWGISISNDILAPLGSEIALIFSDIKTEGIIPTPKIGLAIKALNKEKIDKLISNVLNKNNEKAKAEAAKIAETAKTETSATQEGTSPETEALGSRFQLSLTDESYDGQTIKALQLPIVGAGFTPGYTYINDYLVIGATTGTVQEIIDVSKGKIKPLTQDATYMKIAETFPKENNQLSFINLGRLVDISVGIAKWVVSFQQMTIPQGPAPTDPAEREQYTQQKAQAEATIATINNNVVPFLNTLRALKFVATVSVNKKDHIEQKIVLNIEDLK